jgi:hypothetical protein
MQPRYRRNLAAGIAAEQKVIVRGDEVLHLDLRSDPSERQSEVAPLDLFCSAPSHAPQLSEAIEHLRGFQMRFATS